MREKAKNATKGQKGGKKREFDSATDREGRESLSGGGMGVRVRGLLSGRGTGGRGWGGGGVLLKGGGGEGGGGVRVGGGGGGLGWRAGGGRGGGGEGGGGGGGGGGGQAHEPDAKVAVRWAILTGIPRARRRVEGRLDPFSLAAVYQAREGTSLFCTRLSFGSKEVVRANGVVETLGESVEIEFKGSG